eukprot:7215272-Alexandrium_andersonii.AAC.1
MPRANLACPSAGATIASQKRCVYVPCAERAKGTTVALSALRRFKRSKRASSSLMCSLSGGSGRPLERELLKTA